MKYWVAVNKDDFDNELDSEEAARVEAVDRIESNPYGTYVVAQVVAECSKEIVTWKELE